MQNWSERFEEGLFQKSRSMAPPWGPVLRALRFPTAIVRDWIAGEINVRAMSLAYTTLLSLVPLMVFSFSILKTVGAHGDLRYLLHQFFRPLGASADQLTETVMQFVTNMRGDVLGVIGLTSLIYTVIATIQKIEASFNFVWRIDKPRSFGRRIIEYLSVMIVGPVLLALALGLLGAAEHSPLTQWLTGIAPIGWIIGLLGRLVPYVIVTVVFTFMYSFVPNMKVQFRAALTGGVAAGIIWALVGTVFTAVIRYSTQMMVVYSSFAIVLTTLIWIYLSWLILLIGAQLAFYVQFPQYLRHGHEPVELTGGARERAGLSAMLLIGAGYRRGSQSWTAPSLAGELDVPTSALTPVLSCLERAGLIVETNGHRYVPARDPAAIRVVDIIEAVRTRQPGRLMIDLRADDVSKRVMLQVDTAIAATLGDQSLEDLIGAE
jgi:membrane protein